jgi:antitoxin HicB
MTTRREYRFTILLHPEPEDGGYSVTVPALPGCYTQGETIGEAVERAREAIALHIEGLLADGEAVPEEAEPTQAIQITLPAEAA